MYDVRDYVRGEGVLRSRQAPHPQMSSCFQHNAHFTPALLIKTALFIVLVFAPWELLKGKLSLVAFVSAAPGRVPGSQSRLARNVC